MRYQYADSLLLINSLWLQLCVPCSPVLPQKRLPTSVPILVACLAGQIQISDNL